MSPVYGGTSVNLEASVATSVYEGFLHSPKHHGGFTTRITTSVYCRVQSFYTHEAYAESATNTHLAMRAWAFQEKLLSPRTIHFGDTGQFWECRSHVGSQFNPDGFLGHQDWHLVGPEDKQWDWRDITAYYSSTDITYSSDRLPAQSGIATRQQQLTGGQYLAGMWRESLTQLLWQRVDKKKRRPNWRAPSWSWISVDGEIKPDICQHDESSGFNECIKVLDAWTRPSGPDIHGAVADGELTVSCSYLVRSKIGYSWMRTSRTMQRT